MKSGQLKLAAFILVLIANLTNPTYAFADSITGETDGDSLIIRGSSLSDGQTATAPSAPSTTITNCVSIGNGQLRCYAVDTAGSLLDGIAAASVVPGAAAGPSAADIAAAVVTEFRRLPLVSGAIQVQPSRGWTLVNVETIVLTSPAQQTFATSVLGIPVTVRASPTRFSWDFGDGSAPLITTEPGAPWPAPTVTHTYATAGTRTITLTTQWVGEFEVAGSGAWQPIAGVATTTAATPPIAVRTASNSLVTAS